MARRRNLPTALIEGRGFRFGYVRLNHCCKLHGCEPIPPCYHQGRTTMRAVYPSNLLNVDS